MRRVCEPRRALGRTGFTVTALGIGDLADRQVPLERCVATARRAIDAGLNLIDTAPNYEDGYSEQVVGEAVRQHGRRDELFVISKIDHFGREATSIREQVEASLRRTGLDHIDLMVFHGLSSPEAWRYVNESAGLMDQLGDEIARGTVRFRGISCHHPEVLREAVPSGRCDVVMFAIGPFVDERYVAEVLPLTRKHGVGSICFKTFGAGKLLGDTEGYQQPLQQRPRGKVSSGGAAATEAVLPRLTVEDCLHYTLTLDPDVALLGMSFPNEQDAAFEAFRNFRGPLSPERMRDIRARAVEAIRGKGKVWWNPPETD